MGYGFGGCQNVGGQTNYCGGNMGNTFALIVVLFILLVIVGATFYY